MTIAKARIADDKITFLAPRVVLSVAGEGWVDRTVVLGIVDVLAIVEVLAAEEVATEEVAAEEVKAEVDEDCVTVEIDPVEVPTVVVETVDVVGGTVVASSLSKNLTTWSR